MTENARRLRAYRLTPKGRATMRRWNSSSKGKAARFRYRHSPDGRQSINASNSKWRRKVKYWLRPSVRDRHNRNRRHPIARERTRKRLELKRVAGICPRCTRPVAPGRGRCAFHLNYALRHQLGRAA